MAVRAEAERCKWLLGAGGGSEAAETVEVRIVGSGGNFRPVDEGLRHSTLLLLKGGDGLGEKVFNAFMVGETGGGVGKVRFEDALRTGGGW